MTYKPHIHILGIGGTFMAGIAALAEQLGWTVTGSDKPLYPPMSDYLAAKELTVYQGYDADNVTEQPDCIVVGNAVARGNPELEAILERNWPVISGPQWLHDYVLQDRTVIAVAGTHGKTTTTSLIAWLLETNGLAPGYLIGGLANNFTDSARLGEGQYFVVEADEYDSAFFDKRSKFIHYWPDVLVLNNLEFDHADIFDDLSAIQKQFQHLLQVVPGNGRIIVNAQSRALQQVLQKGCWSEVSYFNDSQGFHTALIDASDNQFVFKNGEQSLVTIQSPLWGEHNRCNMQATLLVGQHLGLNWQQCQQALQTFQGVQRRLEFVLQGPNDIAVYQDFAHHPTAIGHTVAAMREKDPHKALHVAVDFGSYTMRTGHHRVDDFVQALSDADRVYLWAAPNTHDVLLQSIQQQLGDKVVLETDQQHLAQIMAADCPAATDLVLMSNRNFANIKLYLQDLFV